MVKPKSDKRVAILTDTHFGARRGSQIFHDYFEEFYSKTFFPFIDQNQIDTVIHLGDVFDVRKGIDYWSLSWSKRVFFDELAKRNIDTHILVGNHDIFYKTSLAINSPGLNLTEYSNITVYDKPQIANIKGVDVVVIPWICEDNALDFKEVLSNHSAKLAMGHLEICGFYANENYQCTTGLDAQLLSNFDRVFSGHFHKKSTTGNITYLGNTYQLYWGDEGDTRGFHVCDLGDHSVDFVANPNSLYHKIHFSGSEKNEIDVSQFKNSYIKLIVETGANSKKVSQFVDKLYEVGIHDLKIIDSVDITIDADEEIEAEDTLSSIGKYVYAMEDSLNKENILTIIKTLYRESQEV